MPKSKTKDDWSRLKKYERENEKLRKEVSKLRKIINNMVLDQLEEKEYQVDEGLEPLSLTCMECGNRDYHKVNFNRPDGKFEIKICKSCNHRTKLKRLSSKEIEK